MAGGGLADYSGAVIKDDEYQVEQHYGHSGIRHGKRTCNGVLGARLRTSQAEVEDGNE